ncbi:MAG: SDR family NAD(P)-dependent oxidoreductase [Novosphingobium sp.]|nr:SDR family NAD(P)-dependent oxidoreductase [Novosphingobium sp.]
MSLKHCIPRLAIFGASGGIGRALCECLAESFGKSTCIYAGSRQAPSPFHPAIRPFCFDLEDEQSIAEAASLIREDGPLDLAIVATGMLHGEGVKPERSWRELDGQVLARLFAINTIGPALVAKHVLPLLRRNGWAVFAALSARVGSIEDNRIGGWHGYRASKAALNQMIRNFAIELRRINPEAIAVALHSGTVDTRLSAPYQRGLPKGQLVSPMESATNLLRVIDRLEPEDSGGLFAWDGTRIPF